jgi:hypothetical protein
LTLPAGILDAGVEHPEIVDDLDQPLLAAELAQFSEQRLVSPNLSPNRSIQPWSRAAVALLETFPVLPAISSR